MRRWIKRLERGARGEVESFELRDGSRYWFGPLEVAKELFLHGIECGRAGSLEEWPEPPEGYPKICEAKDPTAVLEGFVPSDKEAWFIEFPYDRHALISERRLVAVEHEPVPDISE